MFSLGSSCCLIPTRTNLWLAALGYVVVSELFMPIRAIDIFKLV